MRQWRFEPAKKPFTSTTIRSAPRYNAGMEENPKRWFRFRLRTLFVLAVVVAAVIYPASREFRKRRDLERARQSESDEITRQRIARHKATWGILRHPSPHQP
jgi:hypothetical protein